MAACISLVTYMQSYWFFDSSINSFATESASSFCPKALSFGIVILDGKSQLRTEEKVRKYCGDYADFSCLIVSCLFASLWKQCLRSLGKDGRMVVSDLKITVRACADLAATLVIHDLSDSSTSKNISLHLCAASSYISPRSAALRNQ